MMKNTKGITLVALVITIIILLILAGISIQTITQTNLFKKAERAKEETEQAQEKENEMLSNYIDSMNEYLPDTLADKVKKREIEIGSYVNYSPDTINNEKYKKLISNLSFFLLLLLLALYLLITYLDNKQLSLDMYMFSHNYYQFCYSLFL